MRKAAAARPLGLVAGNGELPLQFCRAVRQSGRRIVAVALHEEADARLEDEVDLLRWQKVGHLGGIVRALRREGVREACFLGGVRKRHWLRYGRPDFVALRLLWSLVRREDDALLRAIAATFERRGIRIVESLPWLQTMRVSLGVLGQRAPTSDERRDINYGLSVCLGLGRHDIGQCAIVKDGAVVAVEAMEGTDACIARAGAYRPRDGLIVVKAAKPHQDMRFDVPTVGPKTIDAMRHAKASVLALEAGRVMMLEPERVMRLADAAGIAVYGCAAPQAAQVETSVGVPAL